MDAVLKDMSNIEDELREFWHAIESMDEYIAPSAQRLDLCICLSCIGHGLQQSSTCPQDIKQHIKLQADDILQIQESIEKLPVLLADHLQSQHSRLLEEISNREKGAEHNVELFGVENEKDRRPFYYLSESFHPFHLVMSLLRMLNLRDETLHEKQSMASECLWRFLDEAETAISIHCTTPKMMYTVHLDQVQHCFEFYNCQKIVHKEMEEIVDVLKVYFEKIQKLIE
jgi:hypothetical protein